MQQKQMPAAAAADNKSRCSRSKCNYKSRCIGSKCTAAAAADATTKSRWRKPTQQQADARCNKTAAEAKRKRREYKADAAESNAIAAAAADATIKETQPKLMP
jgi:hypothetical protein